MLTPRGSDTKEIAEIVLDCTRGRYQSVGQLATLEWRLSQVATPGEQPALASYVSPSKQLLALKNVPLLVQSLMVQKAIRS